MIKFKETMQIYYFCTLNDHHEITKIIK